ncbi:SixA phosphatase family protein [Tessaracoccus caeni]|uniref:SixA phosphatase family protein n=1 Tax=Tessaracoccus caeni TaxID=3031239 RepID=UPI0023DABCE4|nr:histidine phosphatase family protein [Tessaracoccus caeni]MDF1488526.1 histidine phosphatase family protein [Tessaracoccus caeni]
MITLTLVRHAKSDWSDPWLADHDRPLNERGARNAPMMARRFVDAGVEVQRILSSTAVRARTTASAFGAELGIPVELEDDLYHASARDLLLVAGRAGVSSVMLVAHDPGLSDLASRLSAGRITHMPTCAVATFTWNLEEWQDVMPPADAMSYDTPRSRS